MTKISCLFKNRIVGVNSFCLLIITLEKPMANDLASSYLGIIRYSPIKPKTMEKQRNLRTSKVSKRPSHLLFFFYLKKFGLIIQNKYCHRTLYWQFWNTKWAPITWQVETYKIKTTSIWFRNKMLILHTMLKSD